MKTLVMIAVVVLLLGVGFGAWGFVKAQSIKEKAKEIQQITAETLVLREINQSDFEINLAGWKKLVDDSVSVKNELDKIENVPENLKNKIFQFYDAKAQDKYKEAQYLQILLDGQRKLDLKSTEKKSKGQIETILQEFDILQKNLTQSDISLGPDFNNLKTKLEQEAGIYKTNLTDLSNKMNLSSPATQLSVAGLDKAVDELKDALIKSLNDYVQLQNEIKSDIANLANASWVWPF